MSRIARLLGRYAAFSLIFALSLPAQAGGLDAITTHEAGSGVKEALAKGADYAIATLGKENGFLGNPQAKIPLPESLHQVEKAMRAFGMGKQADELVNAMNHAAEKAVAQAKPILQDAIHKMTLDDAKGILLGGDDSVTQFFKRSSTGQLTEKFMPIVKEATQKAELAKQYNKFAGKAAGLGLLGKNDADLDSYVTRKAMDGLFSMIAEQEKSVRQNPMGTGSALLGKVFGALK